MKHPETITEAIKGEPAPPTRGLADLLDSWEPLEEPFPESEDQVVEPEEVFGR